MNHELKTRIADLADLHVQTVAAYCDGLPISPFARRAIEGAALRLGVQIEPGARSLTRGASPPRGGKRRVHVRG
jgi:hypothetical protein